MPAIIPVAFGFALGNRSLGMPAAFPMRGDVIAVCEESILDVFHARAVGFEGIEYTLEGGIGFRVSGNLPTRREEYDASDVFRVLVSRHANNAIAIGVAD